MIREDEYIAEELYKITNGLSYSDNDSDYNSDDDYNRY